MKLKEFVEIALIGKEDRLNTLTGIEGVGALYGVELEKFKKIIKECDEFAKCDSLDILTMPIVKGENDKVYTTETIKLSDLMEFKGRCNLLSLSLTPEMYDPNQLIKPVKNGAAIGPIMYDPMTFEPRKHILLTWSPEMAQDMVGMDNESTLRNDIHKLLDDVLDNPDEYKTKGTRHVLVRGLFEVVDKNDGSEVVINHYNIDLTADRKDVGYLAYYLEPTMEKPGEVSMNLKHKVIPTHLKDKFIEELGTDVAKLNAEVIDKFLDNNNVPRPFDNDRLRDILKKNKDVEDRVSEFEKNDKRIKNMIRKTQMNRNL
jgi:hypothetical protein